MQVYLTVTLIDDPDVVPTPVYKAIDDADVVPPPVNKVTPTKEKRTVQTISSSTRSKRSLEDSVDRESSSKDRGPRKKQKTEHKHKKSKHKKSKSKKHKKKKHKSKKSKKHKKRKKEHKAHSKRERHRSKTESEESKVTKQESLHSKEERKPSSKEPKADQTVQSIFAVDPPPPDEGLGLIPPLPSIFPPADEPQDGPRTVREPTTEGDGDGVVELPNF